MDLNIEQRKDIAHILLKLCDNVLSTCNSTNGNIDIMNEILNNISKTINEIEKHI